MSIVTLAKNYGAARRRADTKLAKHEISRQQHAEHIARAEQALLVGQMDEIRRYTKLCNHMRCSKRSDGSEFWWCASVIENAGTLDASIDALEN